MIFKKMLMLFLVFSMGFILPVIGGEIHSAAKLGDFNKVKQFIEQNPKLLNEGNKLNQTPLLMASFGGHRDIVEYLLDKGAKIDLPDVFGATPLHMAVLGEKPDIVQLLIDKGANINAKTKNGKIPMQMAFEKDNTAIVEIFLKQGTPIGSPIDSYGRTLLHEAVIMGKPRVTNFLIDKGAPLETEDKLGKTPLDLAYICDNKSLAQLLMDKGAKQKENPPLEITYIANAGFLISSGQSKILVDSLFQYGFGKYSTPSSETIDKMIQAKPPFDNINFLLVTFKQAAHFDPQVTEKFLVNNQNTMMLTTQQACLDMELYGSQFQQIKDRVVGVTISPPMKSVAEIHLQGMNIKILRLNFSTEYQALGYIINLGRKTLCFLGDTLLKNNSDYIKQLRLRNERIDVLFITYWDFFNAESRLIIDQEIQPEHIAIMHIPTTEVKKITGDIEKLKKEYPNITIFKDSMQKETF